MKRFRIAWRHKNDGALSGSGEYMPIDVAEACLGVLKKSLGGFLEHWLEPEP